MHVRQRQVSINRVHATDIISLSLSRQEYELQGHNAQIGQQTMTSHIQRTDLESAVNSCL